MKQQKHTVTLPNSAHQPSKAELEQEIKINIPGRTIREKMDNFACEIMRPVKIEYRDK